MTTSTPAVRVAMKSVAKIAGANMNPDRIFGLAESIDTVVCGTLFGIAEGILIKTDAQDKEVQGFTGSFEYVDAEPEKNAKNAHLKSGVLYLPAGINEELISALKAAGDGGQVKFAFEVSSERANNARKRSWAFESLTEAAAYDPMAEMKAAIASRRQAAIAPPAADTAETPETGADTGKGGKK